MSQLGNEVVEASASTSPREHGVLRPILIGVGGLLLWQMLAGYLFLWWIGSPPHAATPLTIVRYAYYYGDKSEIRRSVLICSALGFVGMGGTALLSLIHISQPTRPLTNTYAVF